MDGKLLFAFFGTLLLMGTALAQQSDQQDMSALQKERRIAVVNELIKAQEQVYKALKKMYKSTAQPGEHYGSDEDDCSDEDDSHSSEEDAYLLMKQKKIHEARNHIAASLHKLVSNFRSIDESINSISTKVHEQINHKKSVVNYNLYYKKPSRPHHHSYEEDKPKRTRPRRSHYRSSRQLQDVDEPVAEEEDEQEKLVKAVDGDEMVQTIPETE